MGKSNVSELERGGGLFVDIMGRLYREVRRRGGPEGVIHRLATDEGEATIAKLADVIVADAGFAQRVFRVTIDPSKTVKEMVAAGRYGYVDPDITDENFPSALTGDSTITADVVAFRLGRHASSDEVKAYRDTHGLQPIDIKHELAVGEQFPNAQRELFCMVNPDSIWVGPNGNRNVSFLHGDCRRSLSLHHDGSVWHKDCWFLGLRKPA